MCKKTFLALGAVVAIIHDLGAQCLGSCCSAANVSGATSSMLSIPQKGEWLAGVSVLTLQYEPLSDSELIQHAQPDVPVYSVRSQWSSRVNITYGISNRFSASVALPYNYSSENKEGHYHTTGYSEVHTYGSIRGLGDGSVMANYELLNKNSAGWNASVNAGIKIPTGKTDASSTYDVILPVHLQPGTGSWDPLLQISAAKSWNRLTLQGQAFTRIATTALEHNMGDYFRAEANVGYELMPASGKLISSFFVTGGLAADHNAKMKFAANHNHSGSVTGASDSSSALVPFSNSGFTRVLTSVTLRVTIAKHLTVPLQISVPVWQHLEGYQASLRWDASAGLNYSF